MRLMSDQGFCSSVGIDYDDCHLLASSSMCVDRFCDSVRECFFFFFALVDFELEGHITERPSIKRDVQKGDKLKTSLCYAV